MGTSKTFLREKAKVQVFVVVPKNRFEYVILYFSCKLPLRLDILSMLGELNGIGIWSLYHRIRRTRNLMLCVYAKWKGSVRVFCYYRALEPLGNQASAINACCSHSVTSSNTAANGANGSINGQNSGSTGSNKANNDTPSTWRPRHLLGFPPISHIIPAPQALIMQKTALLAVKGLDIFSGYFIFYT